MAGTEANGDSTRGQLEGQGAYRVTLKNKIIAVTGANQGIGLALAEVFLSNGAECVYSLDVSPPGSQLASLQELFPGQLQYIRTDITDEESVSQALETIVAQSSRLDGLVANAGITAHKAALDFSRAEIDKLFNVNFHGSWNCLTAAARIFLKLNIKGSIVLTSSMASYAANKAALRSIAKTVAMEWADHGIRVNTVSPGFIRTELSAHVANDPDWMTKMKYWRGMPRLGLPQELGGAYTYLLSDAASYTTGIDIPIHGSVGAW